VAIKIPLDVAAELETLTREARIWVQASGHPNVLPVIEADIYDGQVVIVSEYAAGGSLAAWLRQQPQPICPSDKVMALATGILAGLGFLHARGIVHRDLKPANILLQGDAPRLTDFGLARVLKARGHSHTVAGTPAYMAPEAWDGHHSEPADLWSVGVILYEMLAGTLPFPQTELMPLYRAISSAQLPTLSPRMPPEFAAVIQGCLKTSPEKRYQSAAEMLAVLRSTRKGEGPTQRDSFEDFPAGSLIHHYWKNLEPDLQDALALAFNQAKREGKNRISTRTFFAALGRLKPGRLSRLLNLLPEGSLPGAVAEDVPLNREILAEKPLLASCVESAFHHLGDQAKPERKLAVEDVFVDVAKYGTGASVVQLRTHGVTPETIDRLVKQLGWRVARRKVND
jgi:serine/threonine protein kinase